MPRLYSYKVLWENGRACPTTWARVSNVICPYAMQFADTPRNSVNGPGESGSSNAGNRIVAVGHDETNKSY